MLFSATYACPTCMLRFARRARCPECGGARVMSLHTEEERADFRRLGRRARNGHGALARLADSGPSSPRFVLVLGLALFVPAVVVLVRFGASGDGAMEIAAMAVAGGALLAFSALTRIARAASEGSAPERKLLVHAPRASHPRMSALRGVVRAASITLESPIARTPCIAFGLHGDADGAQLDDAEGGDFDLELESGERVMVSLEHAVLVSGDAGAPSQVEPSPYLEELLDDRGLGYASGSVHLAEVVVREGDVVTIEAELSGGAALSFGERAPSRVRVAAGDESHPLVVRVGIA